MKKIAYTAFASLAALTLAACGSSDNASEEATAEDVEMPADEAMTGVEEPAADANAMSDESTTTPTPAPSDTTSAVGDAAADVAAQAEADAAAGDEEASGEGTGNGM